MHNDLDIGAEGRAISQALEETGVKFTIPLADTLKAFGREIQFDDGGKPHALYDGEILPLSDALTRWAYDHREFCDGRTLPRTGTSQRPGIGSKADYTTPKEKAAFINQHGIEAWERLPLTNVAGAEIVSKAQWYKLPTAEKIRRLAADPAAFEKLPNTPPESIGGMKNGARINHAALEKQRQIRPNR